MFHHRNASHAVVDMTLPHTNELASCSRKVCGSRRALTLVELTISLTITSMMSVVLLGLVNAVQTAQRHSEGQQSAALQAQATFDRISYMVSQAGTYKLEDEATRSGLKVVSRAWYGFEMPDILVVWSGGRDGGMAQQGQLSRLPLGSELIVYAPDLKNPTRFFEYAFPDWTSSLDFNSDAFDDEIIKALQSDLAEGAKLSDRVRVTSTSFGQLNAFSWPNVRFALTQTPSAIELETTDPTSEEWSALPWSQGITTSVGGLVRSVIRMELQLEPRRYDISDATTSVAIPFLASASTRYVYEK